MKLSNYDFNELLAEISSHDINVNENSLDISIAGNVSFEGSILISHPRGYDEAVYIGNTLYIKDELDNELFISQVQESLLLSLISDMSNSQRIKSIEKNINI